MEEKMCKMHPERKGEFYIEKQPWSRLCKQCALNRVICGYKIQKDLSPQQFENKIILSNLVQELKSSIQIFQRKAQFYAENVELIKTQLVSYVDPLIKNVDNLIAKLAAYRSQLAQINDKQINGKISKIHENQSKIFMQSINFKKHLENLQDNYCNIIEENQSQAKQQQFKILTTFIKSQLQKGRKCLNQQQKVFNQSDIKAIKREFEIKIEQIQQNLKISKLNMAKQENCLQFIDCRNLNQRKKSTDDKIIKTPVMQKKYSMTSRKPSNFSSALGEQNKAPSITSSSHSKAKPNLTLKGMRRNSSICTKLKEPEMFTFKMG